MELYYGIIFMEMIPGMPGTSQEPPWDPKDPLGTALGSLGTLLRRPGTPLEPLETFLRRLRYAPGTPRDLQGPLMDHKNGHISTNRQRQKLLIAVFEAAHEGPSPAAVDRAVFSTKRPPKSQRYPPIPGCRHGWGTSALAPYVPGYIYIYILAWTCQLN